MKAYTDIEQSKKLAEILPVESADQIWERIAIAGANLDVPEKMEYWHNGDTPYFLSSRGGVPCWSLAALLEALPHSLDDRYNLELGNPPGDNDWYIIYVDTNHLIKNAVVHGNLIDACVEMIVTLKENNLI